MVSCSLDSLLDSQEKRQCFCHVSSLMLASTAQYKGIKSEAWNVSEYFQRKPFAQTKQQVNKWATKSWLWLETYSGPRSSVLVQRNATSRLHFNGRFLGESEFWSSLHSSIHLYHKSAFGDRWHSFFTG